MRLEPLGDTLLLERAAELTKTAGGLFIPPAGQEKSMLGTVVCVGEGRMLPDGGIRPMTVKVGEKVIVGKYAGVEFDHNRRTYLLVKESDILVVLRDERWANE